MMYLSWFGQIPAIGLRDNVHKTFYCINKAHFF